MCTYNAPYVHKKRYQEHTAKRLAAAELEPETRSWQAFTRLRIRVHGAREHRERDRGWRASFEEQIARANAVLKPALAIELEVEDARDWDPKSSPDVLHPRLEELIAHDPGEDVDWVIGLVGSMPRASLDFRDLGEGSVLGKHIVLRDMNDAEEQRVLGEVLDTLSDDERLRLYGERKRHKQTVVLLHEIGHTLSAIHVRDATEIMHPSYDNRMQAFAEPNVVLMKRVLAFRRAPEAERDWAALYQGLTEDVRGAGWDGWVEQERAEYVAKLEAAARAPQQAGGAAPAPTAIASAASAQNTATDAARAKETDVSALPEADRTAFAEARAQLDAGKLREARAVADRLADRYPDSYAVQHLACTAAMRSGGALKEMRKRCDRMAALARQ